MSADLLEALRAARALIAAPESWIQGDYEGYDSAGVPTGCFCAVGAVMAVTGDFAGPDLEANPVVAALGAAFSGRPLERHEIENWNDQPTTTHADVLALFDRAIERVS